MSVAALLLCGGRGERLGMPVPKSLASLAGRPLFTWSLSALERCSAITAIVVVGPVKHLKEMMAAAGQASWKVTGWVEGGRERQESVARGLLALPEGADHVLVHDAARALVEPPLLERVIADGLEHGAAIAAIRLADTLKRGSLDVVEDTVPRASLWCAQTPQVFRRAWLEEAHRSAPKNATDDAMLVEALGKRVHLTEGDPLNFKITTPRDLELAEAWLTRAPART
ncbi:MAG TPA: 2-C-methyl-D-erythritol 4-phosphate cytidylyltransferase [Candidatus Eisenbacteria bacterium]|nr:2-C-methyl-D-erythritol 4-phosphate cytidylyltransferase [Candidatus Eisenbacteria bacterium]